MSSINDLLQDEKRLGFTMLMPGKNGPKYLDEIVAEEPAEDYQINLFSGTCGL